MDGTKGIAYRGRKNGYERIAQSTKAMEWSVAEEEGEGGFAREIE